MSNTKKKKRKSCLESERCQTWMNTTGIHPGDRYVANYRHAESAHFMRTNQTWIPF